MNYCVILLLYINAIVKLVPTLTVKLYGIIPFTIAPEPYILAKAVIDTTAAKCTGSSLNPYPQHLSYLLVKL